MIRIMISKLDEWYEENIEEIQENRWVININSHFKTHKLLKEFMFKFDN